MLSLKHLAGAQFAFRRSVPRPMPTAWHRPAPASGCAALCPKAAGDWAFIHLKRRTVCLLALRFHEIQLHLTVKSVSGGSAATAPISH